MKKNSGVLLKKSGKINIYIYNVLWSYVVIENFESFRAKLSGPVSLNLLWWGVLK